MHEPVGPMTSSEIEEWSKYYKPLDEAPPNAVDCILELSVHSVVEGQTKRADEINAFIEGLPDDFYWIHNGSIHEYDFGLSHFVEAKRSNPHGYEDKARWANYPQDERGFGGFYSDYDVFYLPDYIVQFFHDYGHGFWLYPYLSPDQERSKEKMEHGERVHAEEVWDLINKETAHAMKLWQASRKGRGF